MSNLELLLELGAFCIDIRVAHAARNFYQKRQAVEAAHSLVFSEGLCRCAEGVNDVPEYLHEDGLYSEFNKTFQRAFDAPAWVNEQYQAWSEARKALPFLKVWMPYSNLLGLEHNVKEALLKYEGYRVDSLEDGNECIDGYTSGHHKDLLNLLEHATNNVSGRELGECWVYMGSDQVIQFDGVIDSLKTFNCEYIYEGIRI